MPTFDVTYRIAAEPEEATRLAESILLEQTVETPRAVAERDPFVRNNLLGSIRDIKPDGVSSFLVTLALPVATASESPAQFLNVLLGNTSLHTSVTLEDFTLPPALQDLFRGPTFGIEGLRAQLGVRHRALTGAVLKPVGRSARALAHLCRTLALGGIDLIKDDHFLADHAFCPFEERVRACQYVVDEVRSLTGRAVAYVPHLSGTPDQVKRQVEIAQKAGVRAVMATPAVLGLPFFYELTHSWLDVPVLAHPSFAGTARIRPEILFGKLFRLYGADAVIFAGYGGRFGYDRATCRRLSETLRAGWASVRPALPVPAGGMTVERAVELVEFFGLDTMLLIGGSLLQAGDELPERVRELVEAVQRVSVTLKP